jgi:hypothetical protein
MGVCGPRACWCAGIAGCDSSGVGLTRERESSGNDRVSLSDFQHQLDLGCDHRLILLHRAPGDANTIRIGGTSVGTNTHEQNRTFINGIRGVTVADSTNVLIDANTGQLGTTPSSRRYKEDIESMGAVSERLLSLRPVTFRYRKAFENGEKPLQLGLVAEEVTAVFPELVVYDKERRPQTVKCHLLSTLLLNELQKQARINEDHAQRMSGLEVLVEGCPAADSLNSKDQAARSVPLL